MVRVSERMLDSGTKATRVLRPPRRRIADAANERAPSHTGAKLRPDDARGRATTSRLRTVLDPFAVV